jgi:hypothetical protein
VHFWGEQGIRLSCHDEAIAAAAAAAATNAATAAAAALLLAALLLRLLPLLPLLLLRDGCCSRHPSLLRMCTTSQRMRCTVLGHCASCSRTAAIHHAQYNGPAAAHFAAAANVCDDENYAAVQQWQAHGAEVRVHADAVRPIP